jgi:glyoxylase-like metal-dependent hydrolase (beta-lactamase superfamily II)
MNPIVQTFFDRATGTATHLVRDPATGQAALIDPVLDYDPHAGRLSTSSAAAILRAIQAQNLTLAYVLETHIHADHLSAGDWFRRRTGAKIAIGARISRAQEACIPLFEMPAPEAGVFDHLLEDGDTLALGNLTLRVLHTPGHTQSCVTYLFGDAAFVGDTMFMPDFGTARADFPGGDARTLYRSIRRILALPDTTRIFVGHDYLPAGREEYQWETTVAAARAANVHVHDGVSEDDFVAMRQARDAMLRPPALILPALQVNVRAGALPEASPAGRVFLKIPLALVED